MHHDASRSLFGISHRIKNLLRNNLSRFIPADSLPFSLTSFANSLHRIEDSIFFIHHLRVLNTFVTSSWVEIWNFRVDSRISCTLVLPSYHTIIAPNLPSTVTLTVYAVISITMLLFLSIRKAKLIAIHLLSIGGIWVVVLTIFYFYYICFSK